MPMPYTKGLWLFMVLENYVWVAFRNWGVCNFILDVS